jgi:hypothetical protein
MYQIVYQAAQGLLKTSDCHSYFFKKNLGTFSYLLINSEEWPVRQMCTVLLKRNLITLYENLNEGEKAEFRNVLLTQYIK